MPSIGQAVLQSWSVPPAATVALTLTAIAYLRGWLLMRRARVPFVPAWRAISFLLGLLTLWVALASPLDTFSGFLITAHMLQHMLLMMIAPPLLLLGAPLIPLVRGLPAFAAREFTGPFLNWPPAIRAAHALTNLWVALVVMGLAMFAWHTPRLYELALASGSWHQFEHACFFVASLIFWWPVVQPWPSRAQAPRWMLVPYLLVGDLQNTILSAILIFSDRVLYPSYAKMPRLFGLSAQHDQAASGAIMWAVGSLAFLLPAVVIAVRCLSGSKPGPARPLPPALSFSASAPRSLAALLAWPKQRLGARRVEALTFVLLFTAAGVTLATLAARSGADDDQTLRMRATSGPFAVAVFTAPGDPSAGESTFSLLVQDSATQELLPETTLELAARPAVGRRETAFVRASSQDSSNKLLQSAALDLPTAGNWSVLVKLQLGAKTADFTLPLTVVKPDRGLSLPWPWLVLLAFGAILLLVYLRRHRRTVGRLDGSTLGGRDRSTLERLDSSSRERLDRSILERVDSSSLDCLERARLQACRTSEPMNSALAAEGKRSPGS